MKNISLDNPVYLFILIPLLLLIIIPFAIAIRRDNRSKSTITSLVLHIVIACLVALGLAGTVLTTIMTKTQVIIVADVSYSANRNLDKVDEYIGKVISALPEKSEVGVVCFGKDSKLLTEFGDDITSVKESGVDDSATDITQAVRYASGLFDDGVIKRIVIITDGKQTDNDATGELISVVEELHSQNVYIDAMYLDDNILAGQHETQVSGVEYTKATYLNHESSAGILIQSNTDTDSVVSLYKKDSASGEYKKIDYLEVKLYEGYNAVNFDLDTSVDGIHEYKVDIYSKDDYSDRNNEYFFTQSVSGKLNVLLLTEKEEDVVAAKELFGGKAEIDTYFVTQKLEAFLGLDILKDPALREENKIYLISPHSDKKLPVTVDEICKYDEIIISNVDVRNLDNIEAFISTVDTAVSNFGKSLVTMGDTKIQNNTDDVLKQLENMFPVKYGNKDQESKFLGIVLDVSRSMENAAKFRMAKAAAKQLVSILSDEDYVSIVTFYGDVAVALEPKQVKNSRSDIIKAIDDLEAKQGTRLELGLKQAYEIFKQYNTFENKQVMLISDGKSYTSDGDSPVQVAKDMLSDGILVSTLNIATEDSRSTMEKIAAGGGGTSYYVESEKHLSSVLLEEVAADLTETVIEEPTKIHINKKHDKVLDGINSFADIGGYIYAKAKSSATTVLYAEYVKSVGSDGNNITVKAPIYSYWNYGKGRVSSLMTDMTGEWLQSWVSGGVKDMFFGNVIDTNTPNEKIDYPYTMNVDYDGKYTSIEIIPAILDPSAKVKVEITVPGTNEVIVQDLAFDSQKYFYSFKTSELGKYEVRVIYSYNRGENEVSYPSETFFNLSYSPEYDSFQIFDASALHEAIRQRGSISENGEIKIENDEKMIDTYTVDFTMPFLISAAILYIADVIIRKLKWNDIRNLFKKKKKSAS